MTKAIGYVVVEYDSYGGPWLPSHVDIHDTRDDAIRCHDEWGADLEGAGRPVNLVVTALVPIDDTVTG
ncbi:hypothetical protein OHA25_08600 [Nonomuraea sp. NBC_00507]|uniref:hypothetical protein n=1 Tax=Nonomuraea sp. NBC_00507 TaxID=2976002 RepID=UPI002E18EA2D